INVSRVTFSGSACATHERAEGTEAPGPVGGVVGAEAAGTAPGKVESARVDGKREFASVSLDGPPTVRTLIARRLCALYAVEPEGLRLRISESRPAEAALLAERVDDGRRYEVTPGGSSLSGRLPVRVDVYEGDRLAESASISVEALVARAVCIVATGVGRGDVVTEADVTIETRWLSPAADTPPHPTVVIGQSARRRLEPGRVVTDDDVRAAVMVERGEEVSVHTLSGSVVLKSKARAMAQGRQGDLIEVRREGAARSFTARVSERGVVVVALDAADPDTATFHNDSKGEGSAARTTSKPRPRSETPARVPPPAVPKPRTRATR
ncbi:MAG: flagellar basal body P-ring formation protein FlgA, partial [Phycisphaerae bacterium]|nr:flagellar basal body P-ring formation protein FlgA [Phycisphaerae bacterium]